MSLSDTIGLLNSMQRFILGEFDARHCELSFARDIKDDPLAACRMNDTLITIDRKGLMDPSAKTWVRE